MPFRRFLSIQIARLPSRPIPALSTIAIFPAIAMPESIASASASNPFNLGCSNFSAGFIQRRRGAKRSRWFVARGSITSVSILFLLIPGQTLKELEDDLDAALEYRSPHLSAYNLTFEEGTPFHHEYRCGRMSALTEDEEIAMAELIEAKLGAAGLKRYEISNYALSELSFTA